MMATKIIHFKAILARRRRRNAISAHTAAVLEQRYALGLATSIAAMGKIASLNVFESLKKTDAAHDEMMSAIDASILLVKTRTYYD